MDETPSSEWALVVRDDKGHVHGGFFKNPRHVVPRRQNHFHEHWDGSNLNSKYLIAEIWPDFNGTTIEETFFSYFHLRASQNYGYPDVMWSASKNIEVSIPGVHNIRLLKENQWKDNKFNINLLITYPFLDTSYITTVGLFNTPTNTLSFNTKENTNFMVLSEIIPDMYHVNCNSDVNEQTQLQDDVVSEICPDKNSLFTKYKRNFKSEKFWVYLDSTLLGAAVFNQTSH
ncbi:hypothetical protein PPL_03183 [Heterostelium album PN500]|uniref:Uncharacterized protein n=1 Tax=Heterostelium pallidum (strain ATCC 26659 / Pp 5 / PN500) TaxID=670386 RepID=D3B462_HETP5|nr:hypothetical protein PPL_03183 [Heterostelium album PN500]EFA84110.1 hypothetical protein PPL_03183 [Heterostelium album PN500]|eukprot:XP_020436227.1 hypothetical protein PPL_03183 [Heterostelium album PN500]